MFAHIESGGLVSFMRELPFNWKGVTGFPILPPSSQARMGIVPVLDITPPYNTSLYRLADARPSITVYSDRVEVIRSIEAIPPLTPEQQAEIARKDAIDADALADILIEKLKTASPTEIKNYVQNNVTNLETAKAVIGRLAVAVAYSLIH